jgi:hypothetical protein
MIAQDHRLVLAEIADEACLLVELEREAFVIVIADAVGETHRVLRDRQQTLVLRGCPIRCACA